MEQKTTKRIIDINHINPFIESVDDLFTTMLDGKAVRGELKLAKVAMFSEGVIALIGLSGPARGTVALGLPTATSLAMVSKMTGIESSELDETVFDAVAELVNIIAGGAKAKLNEGNKTPISLSLPTVIKGKDYSIEAPSWTSWLEVPFDSTFGPFTLRVGFENV